MTGKVEGIQQVKGSYYLDIGGGRYVAFTDITNVVNESTTTEKNS